MSTTQDCMYDALRLQGFTGANSDMLRAWAVANGGFARDVQLAVLQALQANGATSNELSQAWVEALESIGISGQSLPDMENEFWCIQGGEFGVPFNALIDSTTLDPLVDSTTTNYLVES